MYGIDETACERYQCAVRGRGCELRPVDADRDGSADAERCGSVLSGPLDCDDGDANRHPGAPELCDLSDNDCDMRVDEGLQLEGAEAASLEGEASEARLAASGVDVAGDAYGLLLSRGSIGGELLQLPAGDLGAVEPRSVAYRLLGPPDAKGAGACLRQRARDWVADSCALQDLAIAGAGPAWLAGVQRSGCAAGLLRVGVLKTTDMHPVIELGSPDGDGDLDLGVDSDQACTHPMDASAGVVSPALAVRQLRGAAPDEALVVWRSILQSGAELCSFSSCESRPRQSACWSRFDAEDRCDRLTLPEGCAHDSDVLALRVSARREADRTWITRFDAQATRLVGRAPGTAAAAVSAWPEGYLVAYGAGQGVAVHVLRLSEAPERWSMLQLPAAAADHVAAVTSGSLPPTAAIAWREGCGERAGVELALIDLGAVRELDATSEHELVRGPLLRGRLVLARDVPVRAGPVLARLSSGVTQRPGMDNGGWLIAWVEGLGDTGRLVLARVSELDACLVEPPRVLAEGDLRDPVFARVSAGALRISALRRDRGRLELVSGGVSCVPGATAEPTSGSSAGLTLCEASP